MHTIISGRRRTLLRQRWRVIRTQRRQRRHRDRMGDLRAPRTWRSPASSPAPSPWPSTTGCPTSNEASVADAEAPPGPLLRARPGRDRGSASIEFAITAVAVMAIMFTAIQAACWFWARSIAAGRRAGRRRRATRLQRRPRRRAGQGERVHHLHRRRPDRHPRHRRTGAAAGPGHRHRAMPVGHPRLLHGCSRSPRPCTAPWRG